MAKDQSLTSVKINTQLFEDFKIECIKSKMTFQKLSERAMWLYMNDQSFKELIHNTFQTESI